MWTYTVRKTITTSLSGIEKFEDKDAGLVIPWAEIGIPDSVKFSQPVFNKWDGVELEDPDGTLVNEWLVSAATVRYERRRYTITKEWYGAVRWYKILYKGGTALSTEDGSNVT